MWRNALLFVAVLFVLTWGGHIEARTDSAEYYTGEVEINTTADGEIVVAIDEASVGGPDGLADHLFILQQEEEGPSEFISESLSEATLLYTQKRLAIVSRNEHFALILAVDGTPVTELADSVAGLRPRVVRGFGLSHTYDGLDVPIAVAASEYFVSPAGDPQKAPGLPNEKGGLCDSGGRGADSCSVQGCGGAPSSCSVSCSSTHYACCYCESFGNGRARCKCLE